MGFIKKVLTKEQIRKDAELLAEEKLYEYVGNEIQSGNVRQGLWTKATSAASSSQHEDINREYIRLRVEHLRAEGRLFNQLLEEAIATKSKNKKVYGLEAYRESKKAREAQEADRRKARKQIKQQESLQTYKAFETLFWVIVFFVIVSLTINLVFL